MMRILKYRHAVWRLGLLLVALVIARPVAAQSSGEMILLLGGQQAALGYGDLWTWTPGGADPARQTTWEFNRAPVRSPDGRWAAYTSVPSTVVEAAAGGLYRFEQGRPDPANIWLMDIAAREFVRIAQQPDSGPLIIRSRPAWSPDSRRLAWTEVLENTYSARIVVYDVASGAQAIWADNLSIGFADAGMFSVPDVAWGGSYLMRTIFTFGLEGGPTPGGLLLEVFDAAGLVWSEAVWYIDVPGFSMPQVMWVSHNGAPRVALGYPESGWQLLNPETGTHERLLNPPLLQTVSGQGVRLRRALQPQDPDRWEIVLPGGGTAALGFPVRQVAMSPDGVTVVFIYEQTAYAWRNGAVTPLLPEFMRALPVFGVEWSPLVWMTDGLAEALPAPTPFPPSSSG